MVFAKTDPEQGHGGISAFVVEADTPGFEVGRIEPKMGIKGSTTGELFFNGCRVPAENLLGAEGRGSRSRCGSSIARGRGSARRVSGSQGATDYARRVRADARDDGKSRSAQHQLIAGMLADMETKCEAARGLLYKVGRMIDEGDTGPELTKLSAMAKLYCTDVAMEVTTDAVQVLGGYGYIQEYPVERMMRDAKITQIYEGTNQIQRLVIAREMLKKTRLPARRCWLTVAERSRSFDRVADEYERTRPATPLRCSSAAARREPPCSTWARAPGS